MGLAAAAGIGAVGAIGGGIIQGSAAEKAANTQAQAATTAAGEQLQASTQADNLIQSIYGQNKTLLQPFVQQGTNAAGALGALTGTSPAGTQAGGVTSTGNPLTSALTQPFKPTMQQLSQTPGYQFTLQQGLIAAGAQQSAQGMGSIVSGAGTGNTTPGTAGIGSSGPLGKSLVNYAEGLAGTTYQQQFSNYLSQNQQIYNMLSGQMGQGVSAAGALAGAGTSAGGQSANALLSGASSAGSYQTAGAAANAAGTVGAGTAASNALSGVGNSALLYGLLGQGTQGLTGGVGGSSGIDPLAQSTANNASGLI